MTIPLQQIDSEQPARNRGVILAAYRVLAWTPLLVLPAVTLAIWIGGDRWWWATALMFAPRWPWLVVGAFGAALLGVTRHRWRSVAVWALSASVLMGLRVPVATVSRPDSGAEKFTVLTANVQGNDPGGLMTAETGRAGVDAMFLQEVNARVTSKLIPADWNLVTGSAGVCIASPHSIDQFESLPRPYMPGWGVSAVRCLVHTGRGPVRLVGVHLRTPREGIESLLSKKLGGMATLARCTRERRQESEAVRAWIDQWAVDSEAPLILAGDFNMPVESRIYQDCWGEMENAFGVAGFGRGSTKFTAWHGVRIDHILSRGPIEATRSWVGAHSGSDHRPVFAVFSLGSQGGAIAR